MSEGASMPGRDRVARATMAAILIAQKGTCQCEACLILRNAGEQLIQDLGVSPIRKIKKVGR